MSLEFHFTIGEPDEPINPSLERIEPGTWTVKPTPNGFIVLGGPLMLRGYISNTSDEGLVVAVYLSAKGYPGLYRYLDRISVKQMAPGALLERIGEMRLAAYEKGRADMKSKVMDCLSRLDPLAGMS